MSSSTGNTGTYQVFARKYRPQTFDDVVGQEHITRTLKNAIAQGRLAHAYLFVGPRGIGKTSTARILAKALCCVHGPTPTPCGVCDPCREIAAGNSLDVLEIDGASNNGVEQVRDLRDNVRYAPTRGRFKVYIIDEVHMLSTAAFNALLKTLEEPPEHVKFIFATTDPQKVLPTILSRCQRFDLRRIPAPLIAEHLQKIAGLEHVTLPDDAAAAIAVGADGGLRDAESMLDQLVAFCGNTIAAGDVRDIFGFTAPEVVAGLAGSILRAETPAALAVLDEQTAAGKDLLRLLGDLITHLRNLLVFQVNPAGLRAETPTDTLAALGEQATLVKTDRLLELIDGFAAAEGRMKFAANKKLGFEIAVIKAIQTLQQASLDEVLDALTALREGEETPPAGDQGGGPPGNPKSQAPSPKASAPPARAGSFAGLKQAVAPAKPPSAAPAPPPATTTRVAAKPPPAVPAANATEPPATDSVPPAAAAVGTVAAAGARHDGPPPDAAALWAGLIKEIRSQRPLITAWVQGGTPLEITGEGRLRAGFPAGEKMVVESLNKASNRQFLEGLLSKLAGQPVTLKLELVSPDAPTPTPAPSPTAVNAAAPVPSPAPDNANAANATTTPSATPPGEADPVASFKNDPLIQKALKVFEGEIRDVKLPS